MFKSKTKIACCVLTLCSVIAFSGCSTVDRALTKPAPAPVTEPYTNALGQVVPVTYTPVVLNPAIQPYVDTGGAVVNVLPEPYKTVGGGLLALAGALGTLYVRSRNQLKKVEAVNNSIIAGVDTFANANPTQAPQLKQQIQTIAQAVGTESDLNKAVNK